MTKFLNTCERYFYSYLLFLSFALAASTIFSKGDPAIFSSWIWIIVFIVSGIYLTLITTGKFLKKEILQGAALTSIAGLLIFYFLNTWYFEYGYIPASEFNTSEEALLENDRIMLLEHGFGDTEKLKSYEKAVFLYKSQEVEVKLNEPLKLGNGRKLLLTGNGKNFLITRSKCLTGLVIAALLTVMTSILLVGRQWKQ